MKLIATITIAAGFLLFSSFTGHIQAEDIQMQPAPILKKYVILPTATNNTVKAFLLHLARASSVPMNVEIHRIKGSAANIETQSVGSWNDQSSTISDVLSETKRRVSAFSWQAGECDINLILRDPSLAEDVLLSQLKEDGSFSGNKLDLVIWLGQVFPHFLINYRETDGIATTTYTLNLKKGTSLRQILNSYTVLAGEYWVANIEYIFEAAGKSDSKVMADLSFIRKGNIREQEVFE